MSSLLTVSASNQSVSDATMTAPASEALAPGLDSQNLTSQQSQTQSNSQYQILSNLHIESEDVIRLILQFCRDNDLPRTLMTLQEESKVALNSVDNSLDPLLDDINNGKWDEVLKQLSYISLPMSIKYDLYELICHELISEGEFDSAQILLDHTHPLKSLRNATSQSTSSSSNSTVTNGQERYIRLANLIKRQKSDVGNNQLFHGKSKKERRHDIAQSIIPYIHVTAPNRLLALLGQSLKWQKHVGLIDNKQLMKSQNQNGSSNVGNSSSTNSKQQFKWDLFRGIDKNMIQVQKTMQQAQVLQSQQTSSSDSTGANAPPQINPNDLLASVLDSYYPKVKAKSIKLVEQPGACCYSNSGEYLAIGCVDGLVEVYDAKSGKPRLDLPYQSEDDPQYLSSSSPVTCLSFSNNNMILAIGDTSGSLSIYDVESGNLSLKINSCHEGPILSIVWNSSDSQVLTGSSDGLARVHGLANGVGRILKEFRGHESYVQSALFSGDMGKVITGCADAYVRVYEMKSEQMIQKFHPPTPSYLTGANSSGSHNGNPNTNKKGAGKNDNVNSPLQIGAGGLNLLSINQIILAPDSVLENKSSPNIYVSTECNQIVRMNLQGQVLKTYSSGKIDTSADFRCISATPKTGRFLYGITKDLSLYVFDTTVNTIGTTSSSHRLSGSAITNSVSSIICVVPGLARKDILGITMHPTRAGYGVVWGLEKNVGMLKP